MKKFTFLPLLSLLLLSSASTLAQKVSGNIVAQQPKFNVEQLAAQGINRNDVTHLADANTVTGLEGHGKPVSQRHFSVGDFRNNTKKIFRAEEQAEATQYFTVAQSYHSNYTFVYEGGDVYTYNIGIQREGNTVTLTNLFDMEAQSAGSWSQSYDYPVQGVYDEEAKTITIPSGTVCGDYGGYYDAIMNGGTVSENGVLTPSTEIVFDVEGDLERITAREAIAAQYTYGTIRIYKSFTAALAKEGEAKLITFKEDFDFGETFVEAPATRTVVLINTGGADADFAFELESDDDSYTVEPEAGTVPAAGTLEVTFTLANAKAGEYEGIATLTYDTGNGEDYLVFSMLGTVKDYPDYSAIVKEGDISFKTSLAFPFELAELEDGTVIAQSGAHGAYGQSQLDAIFTVPAGQLGTFSWKGVSNNSSQWYQCAGGYFIDDLDVAAASYTGANQDISGSVQLAPGEHVVRFQYDGYYYTGLEANKLYVYDLALTTEQLEADAAELLTPEINLGNFVLQTGTSTSTANIVLRNKGANDLKVNSITSDNAEFTAVAGTETAATMKDLTIPVEFTTTTAGQKVANLTIETTAGTFTAVVKADVMEMPDFASVVTEGAELMTFSIPNEAYPFIVEDGKAWNKNCDEPNDEYSQAKFTIEFTIPEGKIGYISWDGEAWGDTEGYYNYAAVDFYDGPRMSSGTAAYYQKGGGASAGSEDLDDFWKSYLQCVAGEHRVSFIYQKGGNGVVPEGNKYVVSNIRLHLEDFEAYNAELQQDEVEFKEIYVGPQRYSTATVTLKNTGSEPLSVTDIPASEPFYGIIPNDNYNKANFGSTLSIELWFYPSEKGEFSEDLTIQTTAGDFTVHCKGTAKSQYDEGIIYLGDFEDDAYNWTLYDADGDGNCWNLGTNMWGTYYDDGWYTHAGSQCLASASDWYTPDNWTFSPVITIPESGAELSYWVAAFSPYNWQEHYSFYIAEDVSDLEAVKAAGALIEETMEEAQGARDGWLERTFNLDEYAGKNIILCFRHHDCSGQYLFRLDDVIVTGDVTTGIATPNQNNAYKAEKTFFNAAGVRVEQPQKGLNIIRKQYEDGTVKVFKAIK